MHLRKFEGRASQLATTTTHRSTADQMRTIPFRLVRSVCLIVKTLAYTQTRERRLEVRRCAIERGMNPVRIPRCYVGPASRRLTGFTGGPNRGAIQAQCQTTKR